MNLNEFLKSLKESGIKFVVDKAGQIRTKYKRVIKFELKSSKQNLCPVCALCSHLKKGNHLNREVYEAAREIELNGSAASKIVNAADNDLPFVRGGKKIRNQLLELCVNKEAYVKSLQ